ncbi:aspartate/glutamate racemase family protein [Sphingosinicella microcystinivorans]|uniref:Aspartate racemase n=1 Tax=Sphingosinicella microcystinivorans TaxID=335406 RepID=A0AAD1D4L4_SPHMI|nr:amino acid racemase [Sphingosinicella microcystinivorans]RKS85423.1 aspartate racemase [Sphingosinicella microcystinivorans]BBE33287.1 aspartate racemase [Sphingosinicella microcystinivorans]
METALDAVRRSPGDGPVLGVLGGMGPLATADFLRKLVERTPARRDQDHIPALTFSANFVPDRTAFLLGSGPDPFPALVASARYLRDCGAAMLAMPCNTAHYWHARLAGEVDIPFVSMVQATLKAIGEVAPTGPVGLLATTGTVSSGIYAQPLADVGRTCLALSEELQAEVMSGIGLVKAGQIAAGAAKFAMAERDLADRGAQAIILGCTEIPVALDAAAGLGPARIDTLLCLADAVVDRSQR